MHRTAISDSENSPPPAGMPFRWIVCALLFLATVINYMDRQILGLLAPLLQKDIGWSQIQYSHIVIAFSLAYAGGMLLAGYLIDRVGVKLSYAAAICFWSIAAMLHAVVSSVAGFAVVRALLGFGESANFPAAIKATTEWFASRERALTIGVFNSGANIGAVIAPAIIPPLALAFGWRAAFVAVGLSGLVWVVLWLLIYRSPAAPSPAQTEVAASKQANVAKRNQPTWWRLLTYRQTWAFIMGKFLTDPVWWFYLFWLPKWLNESRGLDMHSLGMPVLTIYAIAIVGSIGGGFLSSALLRRGASANRARKTAMLVCALCALPVAFVSMVDHLWLATLLVGLAAAAHQGWSANLFATPSDMFPKYMVASVIGIGGMAGSLGAVLFSEVIGRVLESTGHYWPLFVVGGTAYLIALGLFQLIAPRMSIVAVTPATT